MRLRVDDVVQVMTGNDKDTKGKILALDRETGRVVVEGVNKVYKHVRRSQRNTAGGRLSKEMPIQASNVQLVCNSCSKPARIGIRYTAEGVKERYCKKCSASQGEISPPRPSRASKS